MRTLQRRHVLALALVSCIVFTACDTSQIDKAAKASSEIAHYTGDAIAVTKSLFDAGILNLQKKDQIASALLQLSIAGKNFNELVTSLSVKYPSGSVPPTAWAVLSQNFDQISKAFVQVLDAIAGASPQLGNSKAMRIIRAAVLTLAVLLQTQGINSRETGRWAHEV